MGGKNTKIKDSSKIANSASERTDLLEADLARRSLRKHPDDRDLRREVDTLQLDYSRSVSHALPPSSRSRDQTDADGRDQSRRN